MRAAAGLDPNETGRQPLKKRQDPPARQALPDNNLPRAINSMDLKN
jgi:hypothetical protein